MTRYTRTEWLVAETLADEQLSFTLWMLGSGVCGARADFEHHFGAGFPAASLLDELRDTGFVSEREGRLSLTALGDAVLVKLGHDDYAVDAPERMPATAPADPATVATRREAAIPSPASWHDDVIFQVLRGRWTHEIDLVGPSVVRGIVKGRSYVPTTTAARADFGELLQVIAAAAALLRTVLDIVVRVREASGRDPSPDEVHAELRERGDAAEAEPDLPVRPLIDEVLRLAASRR